MTKIIDISKWNVVTDWAAVKASGIDGVIIRAGYGRLISQKDITFDNFYNGAKAAGLNVGAYWYSYATTATEAATEAAVFMQAIKGKTFELPVYMDIEEEKHVALGKKICTQMVEAFLSTLENAGYYAGVYSFDGFFATNLPSDVGIRYSCWVARVENVKPSYCAHYDMWQYSWKGKVPGITGVVDMDYCYKDFPKIIKIKQLNGFKKQSITYSISAQVTVSTAADANRISTACSALGMTVVTKKEEK